jgi:hypothetical protein
MIWGSTQDPLPDEPEDEYPDFLWPDDDEEEPSGTDGPAGSRRAGEPVPPAPVPYPWAAPPPSAAAHEARDRRRRIVALSVTAAVAVGLGAGAVAVYRGIQPPSSPAAAASQSPGVVPGQGGGPAGQGAETQLAVVGRVVAVGGRTITIGGGPMQSVKASVTSATRFTGSVTTLTAVHVGDIVAAQITEVNGVARVITLQDPASDS